MQRPSPSSKPGKEDEADEQEDSSPSTSPSSSSHNPNNLPSSHNPNNPQQSPTIPNNPNNLPYLEILCNGQGVPYDMNLASVRAYLWKKPSEDLVFQFRRLDPRHPAPMPVILPPANS